VTEKTTNTGIPRTADPMEMPAASIGVSLKTDAETLRDIEQIQEKAIKAAQAAKRIALR
jgi:hypothetical protein